MSADDLSAPLGQDRARSDGWKPWPARDGLAVGDASGLPVTIDRVANWAKGADGRGLLLVPISAAVKRPNEERRRTSDAR